LIINIASIVITLTEINNETHYVPKKKQNKTKQNKQTFIIELHQFTSGTPYIPQKRKENLQM
jgi:hypothetical protein